jgi:uncharacterized membrane protein
VSTTTSNEHVTPRPSRDIHRNVETIASLRARAEEELSEHRRRVERLTAALGQPLTIYVVLFVVIGWVLANVALARGGWMEPDPPPFAYLQGAVGLAALLMTTMVLTTQNRQSKHAEQRAHLDLQVNLLAEQKAAKLIALVEELRRDLPVPDRKDLVAEVMTQPLDPGAVMNALVRSFEHEEPRDDSPETPGAGPPRGARDDPGGASRER